MGRGHVSVLTNNCRFIVVGRGHALLLNDLDTWQGRQRSAKRTESPSSHMGPWPQLGPPAPSARASWDCLALQLARDSNSSRERVPPDYKVTVTLAFNRYTHGPHCSHTTSGPCMRFAKALLVVAAAFAFKPRRKHTTYVCIRTCIHSRSGIRY